jgi:ParB-like chromosome segregation protein Spo0J
MATKFPVSTPLDGRPTKIPIDQICVGLRLRSLDQETVRVLAESMKALGLKTPITVRRTITGCELVTGLHRLEAARQLGWQEISAIIILGDERDAKLWEISENLHRADLTVLERDEHIREWVRLTEDKLGQVGPLSSGRGHEGGVRKAARELPIPGKTEEARRHNARRAVKIGDLTDDAKAAARVHGIDDNQTKLLQVAAEPPEQQVDKVIEIAKRTRHTPEETAAAKRDRAQRQAAKQASQRSTQAERDAAVTSMAVLILELPEPSVLSFVEKAQTVPLARISELVSAMRALRPEQFEAEHDQAGDAAAPERPHSSEVAATSTCS